MRAASRSHALLPTQVDIEFAARERRDLKASLPHRLKQGLVREVVSRRNHRSQHAPASVLDNYGMPCGRSTYPANEFHSDTSGIVMVEPAVSRIRGDLSTALLIGIP